VLRGQYAQGSKLLARAVEKAGEPLDLLLELAMAQQQHDVAAAYLTYVKVMKQLEHSKLLPHDTRRELWHNIGVVCAKVGKARDAERAYYNALSTKLRDMLPPLLSRTNVLVRSDSLKAERGETKRGGDPNAPSLAAAPTNGNDTDNNDTSTFGKEEKTDNNGSSDSSNSNDDIDIKPYSTCDISSIDVTTMFNLALLYESNAKHQVAEAIYKRILDQHHNYIDCYVRLASMSRTAGHLQAAEDLCRAALKQEEKHQEASLLLGRVLTERGESEKARKQYDRVLIAYGRDSFAKLLVANLHLAEGRKHVRKSGGQQSQMLRYTKDAGKFYHSALTHEPGNVYAANGLALVLALQGHYNEAKDALLQVREAAPELPDAWVNLGHVFAQQGQYPNAIQMYSHAQNKFYEGRDASLWQYLGRAYYLNGQMPEAKRAILRALHILPDDQTLLYDFALTQEEWGIRVLQKSKASRYVALFTLAHSLQFLSLSLSLSLIDCCAMMEH
jgi:tetratricopeptide (TPR) repeat protein